MRNRDLTDDLITSAEVEEAGQATTRTSVLSIPAGWYSRYPQFIAVWTRQKNCPMVVTGAMSKWTN